MQQINGANYQLQFIFTIMLASSHFRIVLQLVAVTVVFCLLQSLRVEAVDYASCAGTDLCAGSSTLSGTDQVKHCCPDGGDISQVGENIYCSIQQDCSK